MGHFHDDVILLLRPESLRSLLSCVNWGFCYLNLAGITKFEHERKNEKDFGRCCNTDAIVQMASVFGEWKVRPIVALGGLVLSPDPSKQRCNNQSRAE